VKNKLFVSLLGLVVAAGLPAVSWALTSKENAERLKSSLTPFGAERSGNTDGSIPAWDGGLVKPASGSNTIEKEADLFGTEKRLFSINANNLGQYKDKLTEGTKTLLKKYPESYRVDVFPTHRTAAAPQKVYDATHANALRCRLIDAGGDSGKIPDVTTCTGGVPFPIPSDGAEAMWNHQLSWQGHAVLYRFAWNLLTANGKLVPFGKSTAYDVRPFYDNLDDAGKRWNGSTQYFFINFQGPPTRVGEAQNFRFNVDISKTQGWLYFPGQRRTRQLPSPCCDTPNPAAQGVGSVDDIQGFTGTLARYDWTLVGKKEIYVPYNNNRFLNVPTDADLVRSRHLNPDWTRWELHRVWVVDAKLREGQRHQVPKARFYLDEDSWQVLLADRYDANGQLWKVSGQTVIAAPQAPALRAVGYYIYDLQAGTLLIAGSFAGIKDPITFIDRKSAPDSLFTPEALASEGVR
jgi:hypothetical protein